MSATGGGSRTGGAVLRGVLLDPQPLVLRRPGSTPHQTAGRPASAAQYAESAHAPADARASPMQPEAVPAYQEGFRAGLAQGEAAHQARDLGLIEASQRMGFEGWQRGLEDGRQAGRAAVERDARAGVEATAARLAQLDRLLAALPVELGRRLDESEDDMVALCHAVVCRILGDELVTRDGVGHLVRQAIRESAPSGFGGGHGQLAIHVHPRDRAALESEPSLAAWLRQHASAGAVQWVSDEHVELGGCVVRSADGALDARLETQLATLRGLLADRPAGTDQGAAASSLEGRREGTA
jgi:flagellar assembly protein FliH